MTAKVLVLLMCLLLVHTCITAQDAVLTKFEVKKADEEKVRKLLRQYVLQAIAHSDNIMAEAYYEQDNPSVLWLIERWNSKGPPATMQQLPQPSHTFYVKDLEPISKEQWRRAPAKDDRPITIMLFVDSRAGTAAHFKEVYHTAMPQFRSEPGVINYQLSGFKEDSTQFVTYEKFRSEAAFRYHLNFSPIQPVIEYLNTSIKSQPFQKGLHRLIQL